MSYIDESNKAQDEIAANHAKYIESAIRLQKRANAAFCASVLIMSVCGGLSVLLASFGLYRFHQPEPVKIRQLTTPEYIDILRKMGLSDAEIQERIGAPILPKLESRVDAATNKL